MYIYIRKHLCAYNYKRNIYIALFRFGVRTDDYSYLGPTTYNRYVPYIYRGQSVTHKMFRDTNNTNIHQHIELNCMNLSRVPVPHRYTLTKTSKPC